jgi:hypothetical protein
MTFKVVTLDYRHTGAKSFKYMIPFTITLADLIQAAGLFKSENYVLSYLNMKSWLCTTYGDACNIDMLNHLSEANRKKYYWSYQEDAAHNRYRLYLKDDVTLLAFQIKWS